MQHQSATFDGAALTPAVFDVLASERPSDVPSSRDPVIEGLVHALLPPEKAREVLRGFYTDTLHSMLMNRLAALRGAALAVEKRPRANPLQTWRLERAYKFIDTNIDKPIRLDALAKASGLSRMHFAAQFRAATGLRPHDYVIRRRVRRARSMLTDSNSSIVEIALSVGFQSQAHFTTVFKHVVGLTPHRWRKLQSQNAA
jgi:AraC family transcriptional regulator